MKKYFFSIAVRGFLALSGFITFLVSAKLFGAEGRGVISYGTSVFAFIGLFFSLNLGRAFVDKTKLKGELKKSLLPTYFHANLIVTLISVVLGLLFCTLSDGAQKVVKSTHLLPLTLTSFFYVWSINGSYFYAAFLKNTYQEFIIAITRFTLVIFLLTFYIFGHNFEYFLYGYCLILFLGTILEMGVLLSLAKTNVFVRMTGFHKLLNANVFAIHLDYLFFNTFPLLLIIISGYFIEKVEIGRINFVFQLCNLIYLLSTTANIKINSYISHVGFEKATIQIKKLFIATLSLSLAAGSIVYLFLSNKYVNDHLSDFKNSQELFLIALFSIPGYVLYQFLSPFWLEKKMTYISCWMNAAAFILFTFLYYHYLPEHKSLSLAYAYSGFYIAVFWIQLVIYLLFRKTPSTSN